MPTGRRKSISYTINICFDIIFEEQAQLRAAKETAQGENKPHKGAHDVMMTSQLKYAYQTNTLFIYLFEII